MVMTRGVTLATLHPPFSWPTASSLRPFRLFHPLLLPFSPFSASLFSRLPLSVLCAPLTCPPLYSSPFLPSRFSLPSHPQPFLTSVSYLILLPRFAYSRCKFLLHPSLAPGRTHRQRRRTPLSFSSTQLHPRLQMEQKWSVFLFECTLVSHYLHFLIPSTASSPCLPPPPPAPNCSDNSSGYLTIPSYLIYLFLSLHTAPSPLQTLIFSCHHRELRSVEWSK